MNVSLFSVYLQLQKNLNLLADILSTYFQTGSSSQMPFLPAQLDAKYVKKFVLVLFVYSISLSICIYIHIYISIFHSFFSSLSIYIYIYLYLSTISTFRSSQQGAWNNFVLIYNVKPPCSVIITQEAMRKYKDAFDFLWTLKRVSFVLSKDWAKLSV